MSPISRRCLFILSTAGSLLASAIAAELIRLEPKTGLRPFAYTNAGDKLPNYVAGAKWGTETDSITTMQVPLDPADSAQHIVLPSGFEAQLWAAEPDITKPICMAWDPRGRLWVAETVDYPNELQREGEGRDRIKICEDTNHDGKADKFTIFADKLSIPTSICFANGGLIVIQGGQTLFLKDTNGDDKADERRVLFKGWGVNDTHATASNLRYGFDNWIWGTVGYSGFDGEVGGKQLKFGMGVFRFKPDGSALEFIRSSNNNTWGLGLSEEGIVFGSTANRNASWYMPLPNRLYESVGGWSAARMESIADDQSIFPITKKIRQVDQHGMYTAGAGHALYTARTYPKEFWNKVAFVTEPTGHVIGWFRLEGEGADFKARNLGSFLASDDEWCAPITAEVGPDGNLWMIDWYNYIVQHNPTPRGFKTGKGNAYETSLRDKRHGRIYRLKYAQGAESPRSPLHSNDELVNGLRSQNQLWRMHAQRLMVERGSKDVVPGLVSILQDTRVDQIGLNTAVIHALYTLEGLGVIEDAEVRRHIPAALHHPSAGVRRAAASVLPHKSASIAVILASDALNDRDAQVRLAALATLAECPASIEAGQAVLRAVARDENAQDRWLREAAASAAARHKVGFLPAFLSRRQSLPAGALEALRIAVRDYATRSPADVIDTLGKLGVIHLEAAAAFLEGIAQGWPSGEKPANWAKLRSVIDKAPAKLKGRFLMIAQRWGVLDDFKPEIAVASQEFKAELELNSEPEALRIDAAKNLVRLDRGTTSSGTILDTISLQTSPTLAEKLIQALAEGSAPEVSQSILARWSRLTPGQRKAALGALLRRSEWATALLDAVETKKLLATDLGPEHWQQLRNNADRSLAQRANALYSAGNPISADREEVVKKLLPAAKAKGDKVRGKEVFLATCAVCHKLGSDGASIGPELTGIGARPREDILVEILDPNRSVEANYRMWSVTTKDGESYSGRLDAETQTSVEILDLTGQKHTVQRKDIAKLEGSNLSIMPVGFESLPESDLASLLEFLASSTEKK